MQVARLFALSLLCPALFFSHAQNGVAKNTSDPLQPLDFLVGTWSAKTSAGGTAAATVSGTYTFRRDLAGHALERSSSTDACKGPADFDCQHHDQFTVFADSASPHGSGLYALYLDSEGHVIYYTITTPDPRTVVFLSQGAAAAPHFRLTYHLEDSGASAIMSGKFEGAAPGSNDFRPYLQWSGTKQ